MFKSVTYEEDLFPSFICYFRRSGSEDVGHCLPPSLEKNGASFSVAIDLGFGLELYDHVRKESTALGVRVKTVQGWESPGYGGWVGQWGEQLRGSDAWDGILGSCPRE